MLSHEGEIVLIYLPRLHSGSLQRSPDPLPGGSGARCPSTRSAETSLSAFQSSPLISELASKYCLISILVGGSVPEYITGTLLPKLFKSDSYRKTLDRSRAPDRRRAPHTGRGSDSLVPIEAGPRLQAGSRIQAGRGGAGLDAGTDVPLCPRY